MDIEKADYGVIALIGNLELLQQKMRLTGDTIETVKNWKDDSDATLLEQSLASRTFDIAWFLLDNNVTLNQISKENRNELHYLAANLNIQGGCEIGLELVRRNVDLNLPDKRYKNTPFWYICFEYLKKRKPELLKLIDACVLKKPDILHKNIAGYSVVKMIEERGDEEINKRLEVLMHE